MSPVEPSPDRVPPTEREFDRRSIDRAYHSTLESRHTYGTSRGARSAKYKNPSSNSSSSSSIPHLFHAGAVMKHLVRRQHYLDNNHRTSPPSPRRSAVVNRHPTAGALSRRARSRWHGRSLRSLGLVSRVLTPLVGVAALVLDDDSAALPDLEVAFGDESGNTSQPQVTKKNYTVFIYEVLYIMLYIVWGSSQSGKRRFCSQGVLM